MDSKDRKPTGQPVVFSMPNEECIWSKAGVIASTECVNAFDCLGCSLEKSVRAASRISWRRAERLNPGHPA